MNDLSPEDWNNPHWKTLCVEIRGAEEGPAGEAGGEAVLCVFNAGAFCHVTLPGTGWRRVLDTHRPDAPEIAMTTPTVACEAHSVMVFTKEAVPAEGGTR